MHRIAGNPWLKKRDPAHEVINRGRLISTNKNSIGFPSNIRDINGYTGRRLSKLEYKRLIITTRSCLGSVGVKRIAKRVPNFIPKKRANIVIHKT